MLEPKEVQYILVWYMLYCRYFVTKKNYPIYVFMTQDKSTLCMSYIFIKLMSPMVVAWVSHFGGCLKKMSLGIRSNLYTRRSLDDGSQWPITSGESGLSESNGYSCYVPAPTRKAHTK